jgi:DNA-binding Xre family transcriptional regulator
MNATQYERDDESALYDRFQKGLATDKQMFDGLKPLVKKISTHIARKFIDKKIPERTRAHQEDIEQEIWILLISKVKAGYSIEVSNLSKYLYASAYNHTVSKWDPTTAFHYETLDPSDEFSAESDYQPYTHDFEGDADKERAFNKIRHALAIRQQQGTAKDHFSDEPVRIKKRSGKGPGTGTLGSPQYKLSPDQENLRDILDMLKLETAEAANLLGIKRPTLSSYLYGKTTGVPFDILESARALLSNVFLIRERDAYMQEMRKTIHEWCHVIGVSDQNLRALSKYLGVHLITLQRWYQGETKPSISSFKRHYRKVMALKGHEI